MICKNPYVKGILAFPCGQCPRCRISRRRILTHRILLESFSHKFSSFVTLTYDEQFLPKGGSLSIRDVQKWLKRLRKAVHPEKIRHYYVGEYGDGLRPHYHIALFGFEGCHYPLQTKFARAKCGCRQCSIIRDTWNSVLAGTGGRTDCAYLELDSAQYIAGYVMKKLNNQDDDRLLRMDPETLDWYSVKPEFAKWSQGLGKQFLDGVVDSMCGYLPDGDVPAVVNHGRKSFPLGRYLRGVLREKYGFSERKAPPETLNKWAEEMQELFEEGCASKEIKIPTSSGFKKFLINRNLQANLNSEQKTKILQKGSL